MIEILDVWVIKAVIVLYNQIGDSFKFLSLTSFVERFAPSFLKALS